MSRETWVDDSAYGLMFWNDAIVMHRHLGCCKPGQWLVRSNLDIEIERFFNDDVLFAMANAVVDDFGSLVKVPS